MSFLQSLIMVVIFVGLVCVGAWYVNRQLHITIKVLRADLQNRLERIRELERQRDSQVQIGLITPPPEEIEEGPELPELDGSVISALDQIEDPEHKEEMAEYARYQASQGVDSESIIHELFST